VNFAEFVEIECPEAALVDELPCGLTLADLEAELGTDPDWPKIKNDLSLLRGYADVLATTRKIRAGVVPEGWTGIFECAACGPVFLEPNGPTHILACPWCFNWQRGLPIPRPEPQEEGTFA